MAKYAADVRSTLYVSAAASLALCALSACGNDADESPPPVARVNSIARDPTMGLRCRLRDALPERATLAVREVAVAAGGLNGPFWLTNAWGITVDGRAPNGLGAVDAVSTLGASRWLSFARGSLQVHERLSDAGRAVRALPNACDVQLLGGVGGSWAVWRRAPQGCVGGASSGPVSVLRISESGQEFSPFSPLGEESFGAVRARMDAGRLVIEARTSAASESFRSTVLDLDGAVLAQSAGEPALCPLSGCVTVAVNRDALRFTPLGGGASWQMLASMGAVRAIAVRGDRALIVQREASNSRHSFAIVDFTRRRFETIYDGAARSAVDVWRELLSVDSLRVGATDRGFAYVGSGSSGELVAREVDCAP